MKFQYATKTGQLKTIEASSPEEAQRIASRQPDAAPKTGIIRVSGQEDRDDRTLPDMDEAGERDLPQDADKPAGRIKNLQDALTTAVELGRRKRNRLLTAVVGESFDGSLRAGDFASVLDAASKTSDRAFETIVDTLDIDGDDELLSVSDAKALGVPYGTTKKEAAAMGLTPGSDEDEVENFSDAQKQAIAQAGLGNADPRVQIAFANSPANFQDDWTRNNLQDGADNSATQLDRFLDDLAAWEAMYGSVTPADPKPEEDEIESLIEGM